MDDAAQQLAQRVQNTHAFKHNRGTRREVLQGPQAPGSVLDDAREQLMVQKSHTSKLLAGGARVSMLRLMLEESVQQDQDEEAAESTEGDSSRRADDPDSPSPSHNELKRSQSRKRVTIHEGLLEDGNFSGPGSAASAQCPEPLIRKASHKRFSFLDVSRLLGDEEDHSSDTDDDDGTRAAAAGDSKHAYKKHTSMELSFLDTNEGRAGKHLKMLRAVSCRKAPAVVRAHTQPHRANTLSTFEHVTVDGPASDVGAYGRQQSEASASSLPSGRSKAPQSADSSSGVQQAAGPSAKPMLPRLQLPPALMDLETCGSDALSGAMDSLQVAVGTSNSSRGGLSTPSSIRSAFSPKVHPDENGFASSPASTPRSRGGLPLSSTIQITPRVRRSSVVVPGLGSPEADCAGPSSPLAQDSIASPRLAMNTSKSGTALPPLSIGTGPGSIPSPRSGLLSPRANALQGAVPGLKEPGLFHKLKKLSSIFGK